MADPARRRQVRRRRIRAALIGALGALAVVAAIVGSRGGGGHDVVRPRPARPRPAVHPVKLGAVVVGQLSAPVQDAAVTGLGASRTVLLGGLTAADVSRPDVVTMRGSRQTGHALLPVPLHDAAAATLGRTVYVFGGANTVQSDQILRFSAHNATTALAGHLPRPLSDIAAAAVGDTAYIVGGFDGVKASDRILALEPARHGARRSQGCPTRCATRRWRPSAGSSTSRAAPPATWPRATCSASTRTPTR